MKKLEWDSDILSRDVFLLNTLDEIPETLGDELFYFRSKSLLNDELPIGVTHRRVRTVFKIKLWSKNFVSNKTMPLERLEKSEFDEVVNLGKVAFEYSRFHEDDLISRIDAETRLVKQISCLLQNNDVETLLLKKKKLIGFISSILKDSRLTLQLGGCFEGFGVYFPILIDSVIERHKQDITVIETEISASNKTVLNYYLSRGFKVTEVFHDYNLEATA